ncbi:integrase arm-type DNA-binding domain-containing protein [Sphingomonas sp. MG17]|uniref:Integrase arm-type DNA-binding domain-containing protein n=1 Tax=Sphingomonas tagetis TaxID=2949092 RepID=A0A9X2KN77_9SPHN|nr:integrase arm-type DNA-binding domain-containing protein [Sphingomonas tagetis]MCP3732565.1 integrase arm-type DNA-binding domain-containing protein [Sphingomonas tagetis]
MLTDAAVRRIKPGEKAFKVSDMHGLYLLVQPNGGRYWRMDYRHDEKRGTLALGVYPTVSLKEAREKRANARKLLDKGVNPSSFKKLTRGVGRISANDSFKSVADEWVQKIEAEGRASKTLEKVRWLLAFAEPLIGSRPVSEITAPEILTVLRTVEVRGRYETARRLRSTCGSVIRYAIATGRADRDVTADLQGALITPKVKHHAAIVDPRKVGPLLRAIDDYEGQPAVAIALRIAPHVFVRPGELRSAEWCEFDLTEKVWTIPGSKMKMGRPHRVPLSRQVLRLIDELRPLSGKTKFLFPSVRSDERSISDNTINAALRRLGYDKDEMTGHGFRAMASSILNETRKWHPDAIERQLAHVENNDVRRAYLRGEHWNERVRMMQFWSDHLDKLKRAGNRQSRS